MPGLKVNNIVRRFGGLVAVNNLSFVLDKGEILGIIGPNGAGKTTVINLIAGTLKVNQGEILFNGLDLTDLPAHVRNQVGIARTFQTVRPLKDFTALENVMVGALFGQRKSLSEARKVAQSICDFINFNNLEIGIDKLTVLELKKIELGRALASSPELLFLDEIMAGLNAEEIWEMIGIIKKIQQEKKIAICIIEHIMKVVKELTTRVIVLDRGEIIAGGRYEEVSGQSQVIAAYLGEED